MVRSNSARGENLVLICLAIEEVSRIVNHESFQIKLDCLMVVFKFFKSGLKFFHDFFSSKFDLRNYFFKVNFLTLDLFEMSSLAETFVLELLPTLIVVHRAKEAFLEITSAKTMAYCAPLM